MANQTFSIRSSDQRSLFVRKWNNELPAKGVICLVHGLGEHSGRYEHVAQAFNKEGFVFYAYDQRGHGKSDGKRGDIPSYDQLLDDLQLVVDEVSSKHEALPLFLYGHSMGGNVAVNFLLKRKNTSIKAALITSPWLTLSFTPPKWQLAMGKLILKISPGLVQSNKLKPDELATDKTVGEAYVNDPLVHEKVSPRLFFAIHDAGISAIKEAKKLDIKTLFVHGTADAITSPESTKRMADASSNELKLWNELFHETHNEQNKEEVIDYNINWIKSQL